MANEHFWIEIENDEIIDGVIERIGDAADRNLRGILEGIGTHALYWLRVYAPIGESSQVIRNTVQSNVRYRPGGLGGGGTYEVIVGVRRLGAEHAIYVHRGTGIYVGRGLIRPRADRRPASVIETGRRRATRRMKRRRPALAIQKRGELSFRYSVPGQPPRPFLYGAYQQALIYARARIIVLGGDIMRGLGPR